MVVRPRDHGGTKCPPSRSPRLAALPRDTVLRLALKLDAAVTGVNGVAYLAAGEPLENLLGLPPDLLRPLGAFLLLFAAAVWFTATRPAVSRGAVMTIALANVAWAVDSIVFLALGLSSPTVVGGVWIALQAVVVGAFAALQLGARPPLSAERKIRHAYDAQSALRRGRGRPA